MRSHLIPEFYLKGFTDPDTPPGNEPYCWVRTTERREWYRRAPGKLCRQKDYYHVRKTDGSLDAAIEKKLGDVENRAREIIAKRVERPGGFSKRDRLDLSLFVATMRGRTALKHEQAEKFALDLERRRIQLIYERLKSNPEEFRKTVERVEQEHGKLSEGFSVENLNPEKHRIGFDEGARAWFAGQSIAASVATGPLIHDMGWTFLISDGAGLFITSDSPCSVIDPTAKSVFVGRYALVNEKSELILPLRRDVALIATWGSEPLVWIKATPEVIRSINLRTARFAERMLISPSTKFPGSEDLRRVAEEKANEPEDSP